MTAYRTTLRFLATICGWVLAAGSMALAGVSNLPGDAPINASVIDAATGGDEVVLPATSKAPAVGASLSIRVASEAEDRTLVIEWTGQPQSAILLVSVDSHRRAQLRQRILCTGKLFGILLLRAIRSTGQATIVFDADQLAGALTDSDLLISIKVVPGLHVQDVVYPPNKTLPRILHEESLSPADCSASFQQLERGDSLDAATFADVPRLRVGPFREGRVQAAIGVDSPVASLQLRLPLGSDDPSE